MVRLITVDQELTHQQNFTGRKIAVLVLSTNNWSVVKENVPRIAASIEAVTRGTFVDIGRGYAQE
jgi:hypothetical protein